MPSVEKAVQWAEAIAADDSHGYSQGSARMGSEFDCSSLVGRSLVAAGFDYPADWSPSTKQMKAHLERIGWKWHAGIDGVRRGDILWRNGHTAWAASSTTVCEAVPRNGKLTGDTPGDQNGQEIRVAKMGANWAGYWRYKGSDAASKLKVDSWIGTDSVTEWQEQRGTVADGVISGQHRTNKDILPRLTSVTWEGDGESALVKSVQRMLRDAGYDVKVDGILGPKTITALQQWMRDVCGYRKHAINGVLDENTAYNIQNALNAGKFR